MIYDMIYGIIYDMIYDAMCLLNAIGLTPGGSSIVHNYTQTIHKKQRKQNIQNRINITIRIYKHNNTNI